MNSRYLIFIVACWLLIYWLITTPCMAQSRTIDSLEAIANREKGDSAKAATLLSYAYKLRFKNNEAAFTLAQRGFVIAKGINNIFLLAGAYRIRSVIWAAKANYVNAINDALKSLYFYKKDGRSLNRISVVYDNLAWYYDAMGKPEIALAYEDTAISISSKINEPRILAIQQQNRSAIFFTMKNYDSCINASIAPNEYFRKIGDYDQLFITLLNVGAAYIYKHEYNKALAFLLEERKIIGNSSENSTLQICYNNLAVAYSEMLTESINSHGDHNKFSKQEEDLYAKAIAYSDSSKFLATKLKNMVLLRDASYTRAELLYKGRMFSEAFSELKQGIQFNDSFYVNNKAEELARIEERNLANKREDSLRYEQLLSTRQFNMRQTISNARIRQQQQELLLSAKNKQLQHLAFLKSQADLANLQFADNENKQHLLLANAEKQSQQEKLKTTEKEKQLNAERLKQFWLYAGGIILLLLVIVYLYYNRQRLTKLKLKNAILTQEANQRVLKAEMDSRINQAELMSLRAQMNPHFIFNILNTIEAFAVDNEPEKASEMIQKFSNLTRMVLESSSQQLVSFDRDIKIVQLYAQLEQIRFGNSFEIVFSIDDALHEETYNVPPMLVQPYVENAIIHGLRNREEPGGLLLISAVLQLNELLITVEDNGIGRAATALLKKNNPIKQKSLGLSVTKDRIALFNTITTNANARVETEDLTEGTRVKIWLPLMPGW